MTLTDATASAPPEPIDCVTAVRRLWDYLDARLPSLRREEVEAHLAACAACPPHFAFAGSVRDAIAASRTPADPDADGRLRERVREALRRQLASDEAGARGGSR